MAGKRRQTVNNIKKATAAKQDGTLKDNNSDDKPSKKPRLECAVCLQDCLYPATLPCKHTFCFLCVKGIINTGGTCALCRHPIPQDYEKNPDVSEVDSTDEGPQQQPQTRSDNDSDNQDQQEPPLLYRWFYEGHTGWWQYDERTADILEQAYQSKEVTCEIMVSAFVFLVDFEVMVQYRKNDPFVQRLVKRDLVQNVSDRRGVAGIAVKEKDGMTSG